MLRDVILFLSENRLARRIATDAPFAKGVARRFVAGETLDDAVRATRALNEAGMQVSLDYLGESVRNVEEATAAADVYLGLLDRIAAERLDSNASLKLTQMGQDIDEAFLRENVGRVLDSAREKQIFIRFDMESSAYTQRTLDFFRSVWDEGYRDIGVVIQSYLYRSESDVRMLNELGARVRLCKGAYKEPESVAFPDKPDVDANYVRLMKLLLTDGNFPGIATHDENMIRATVDYARAEGIPASAFEFQMLYGVRRDLQQRLIDDGWNLRVYVPFGEAWYPYLMRRMAERPANLFFILDAMVRESPFAFLAGKKNGRR
ncbi:MAG TPA: proline dehydrogenase family protein [Longimicrobiales bacterium]